MIVAIVAIPVGLLARDVVVALNRPGGDPVAARITQVVRDWGGGPLVNRIERWYFTSNAPRTGGVPRGGIPAVAAPVGVRPVRPGPTTSTQAPPDTPTAMTPFVATPLADEGVWQPTGKLVAGRPVVYQAFLRPDATHTSLLTGVVWMRGTDIRAAQYNGIDIPGGSGWRYGSSIAPAEYPALLAAMNGGFRLDDSRGGYYAEGRTVKPLVDGRATVATFDDGRITVGQWARDIGPTADLASARQNLDLIVDGGAPVPGLQRGDNYRWGATLGGDVFVWRSGVGVDARGNLIYAAGQVDIVSLANVLARAGAVRAMELDINPGWVSFYTYTGTTPADIRGQRLLGSIDRPDDRYLRTGTRDFIAVFGRDTPRSGPTPSTTAAPGAKGAGYVP
ncbi:MAG: hypothetical protein ACKOZL_01450 [Actinomycetes bacterium]